MGYKTAKELGLKVGDKVEFSYDASVWNELKGLTARLHVDDETTCPLFETEIGEKSYSYITDGDGNPNFAKVPDIQPKLITQEEMKVGQKVKLISSGGNHLWWKFTVGEVYNVEKDWTGTGPGDDDGSIPSANFDKWVWELVEDVIDVNNPNQVSEQINLLQAKVDELTDALNTANKKLETLKEFVQNL